MGLDQKLKEHFLRLTEWTTPRGFEAYYFPYIVETLKAVGIKASIHGNGNLFWAINPDTKKCNEACFMSHSDVCCTKMQKVKHVIADDIVATDETTILGADDKIGLALMLRLSEFNVRGLYYVFVGEERGCIGSGEAAEALKRMIDDGGKLYFNKAISLDRFGVSELIYNQCGGDTGSEEFAKAVCDELGIKGLKPSTKGLITDSAKFSHFVPECVNLSVGYYDHHTCKEIQDLGFASLLLEKMLKVKWHDLEVSRKPEPKWKSYKSQSHAGYQADDYYGKSAYHNGIWMTPAEKEALLKKEAAATSTTGKATDWDAMDDEQWRREVDKRNGKAKKKSKAPFCQIPHLDILNAGKNLDDEALDSFQTLCTVPELISYIEINPTRYLNERSLSRIHMALNHSRLRL